MLLPVEAFDEVIPNAVAIEPPVELSGCAMEIETTPPVFVTVPRAVIVPPVVVPAAMP